MHFTVVQKSRPEVFCKGVLKNTVKFTGQLLHQSIFLIKLQALTCSLIKKETLLQVFSCEFWEVFKNIFFREDLQGLHLVVVLLLLTFKFCWNLDNSKFDKEQWFCSDVFFTALGQLWKIKKEQKFYIMQHFLRELIVWSVTELFIFSQPNLGKLGYSYP